MERRKISRGSWARAATATTRVNRNLIATIVGQVGNLPPIGNRPVRNIPNSSSGGLPIRRRFPTGYQPALRGCVAAPNFRQCPVKVPTQDKLDVGRRVLPAKQSFGKVVNLLGVIDPVQIVLVLGANADVASIQ